MAPSTPPTCNSWLTARCSVNAVPQQSNVHNAGPCRQKARARRFLFPALFALLALPAAAEDAPDYIAVVTGDGQTAQLALVDADTPEAPPRVLGACAPDARPVWSPDGGLLAYEAPRDDGGTQIVWQRWNASEPSDSGSCGAQYRHNRNPAISPGGRFIAYEGYDQLPYESALMVFDRETGEEVAWGGARRALFTPVWLPNPKLLLSLDPNRKVEIPGVDLNVIRAESGLADGSALTGGPTKALFCIGLDNGGGALTTEMLLLTQSQSLPVLALVPDGPDSARYSEWNPRISPGGTRVVFESDYGGDREIYQLDQNGLLNLTNHHAADWNPVWTENGRWVAVESFRDGFRRVHRVLVETVRIEPLSAGECWSPSWSPDGDALAVVLRRDGLTRVALLDAESGKETLIAPPAAAAMWAPAWRPEP